MIDTMSITIGFCAGAAVVAAISGKSVVALGRSNVELQLKLNTSSDVKYIDDAKRVREEYRELLHTHIELLEDYEVMCRSKEFSDQFFDNWDRDRSMTKEMQRIAAIRAAGVDPDYVSPENAELDEESIENADVERDFEEAYEGQNSVRMKVKDLIDLARTAVPGEPKDVDLTRFTSEKTSTVRDKNDEIIEKEVLMDDNESPFGNWKKIETMTVADYFDNAPDAPGTTTSALYGPKEPPKKEGGKIIPKDPKRRSADQRRRYAYLARCRGDSMEDIRHELGDISEATAKRLYNEGRASCNKEAGGRIMVEITNGTEVREVPDIDFNHITGEWGFDKSWHLTSTTTLAAAE